MNVKKIIIDCRCVFDSGIGVYIREVLSELVKYESISIEVILMNNQHEDFLKLNFGVHKLHLVKFGRYSLKNAFLMNNILSRADFYFMPNLSFVPIFSKVDKILVVHDLCPIALRKFFGRLTATLYYCLLSVQILFSKKVICISEFTKEELISYFLWIVNSKVSVIYNGLSTRLSSRGDIYGEMDNKKPYVLCVGNIKPHKNIANLVDFYIKNSRFYHSHDLVVVGNAKGFRTGNKENKLDVPGVVFTGFISDADLTLLYQNAAAYVFPSFYEGFGLPLLEAMSFNLPILASSIPVFEEVAGDSIFYFDPHSFDGFDEGLEKALDLKRKDYSKLLGAFTWDDCVKKMVGLITK